MEKEGERGRRVRGDGEGEGERGKGEETLIFLRSGSGATFRKASLEKKENDDYFFKRINEQIGKGNKQ